MSQTLTPTPAQKQKGTVPGIDQGCGPGRSLEIQLMSGTGISDTPLVSLVFVRSAVNIFAKSYREVLTRAIGRKYFLPWVKISPGKYTGNMVVFFNSSGFHANLNI